jgi:outer membrane protein TolC
MNKKYGFILICLLAVDYPLTAQSNIPGVLSEIARNNKTLQAHVQHNSTQKLEHRVGNAPANPNVEYDYLVGSPSTAGNQTEVIFVQSFDFPTTYFKKDELADQKNIQADLELVQIRQDILLDALNCCIGLVYHHKTEVQLEILKQQTEKLLSNFQERLEKGDGNLLDVNKARLRLLEIDKQLQAHKSSISQLNSKLTALNGGVAITFTDSSYSQEPLPLAFDQLIAEYQNADPHRKTLQQEKLIFEKQVEVNKSLSLPKLEVGYHYQHILGQTFSGIHTGISIPLWENKNTVKAGKSQVLFADLEILDYENQQYQELKSMYDKYSSLQKTLEEYEQVFSAYTNTELLNTALALGHISTIEYFMETSYYYDALKSFLETEKEYNETLALLNKYRL